jgi:hypothetical protein
MGTRSANVAKIICFRCRKADCGCLPRRLPSEAEMPRLQLAWAFAWLGGACVAGSALGAALALLFG